MYLLAKESFDTLSIFIERKEKRLMKRILRTCLFLTLAVSVLFPAALRVFAGGGMFDKDVVNQLVDARQTTSYNFSAVTTFINNQVAGTAGASGEYVMVVKDGEIVYGQGFGYEVKYKESATADTTHDIVVLPTSEWEAVDDNTMWDLASVTKVLATNLALQKLVYEGKISVDDPVKKYIPTYSDASVDINLLNPTTDGGICRQRSGKDNVTIKDLLHHTAGNPPDPQYHNDYFLQSASAAAYFCYTDVGTAYDQLYVYNTDDPTDREAIIKAISQTPLVSNPGETQSYSDVDYIILGLIIEEVTGMPLDQYVETQIYQPLGLTHTMFNPLQKGFTVNDFAATEVNGNTRDGYRNPLGTAGISGGDVYQKFSFTGIRTTTIRGEVHDEKAYYAMAGVSGHAGLFSTPSDIAVLMQLMLNNGTYNGVTLFDKATVDLFLTPTDYVNANGTRATEYALGWYVNGAFYNTTSSTNTYPAYFSAYASVYTFGHQGWTGPIVYADPERGLIVIILRNRPHQKVVSATSYNSFTPNYTNANMYTTISNNIYTALGYTTAYSTLPDFGDYQGVVYHDFSAEPTLKVEIDFYIPGTDIPAYRIGTSLTAKNPKVTKVAIGATAPAKPTSNATPSGSSYLLEPTWSRNGGSYYFNATSGGDYYVSLYNASGGKIYKAITIVDSSAPVVSYDITDPTNSDVVATITTGMEIVTPAGWTKVDATHYTKTFTANGDETVTLDYSASSISLTDTIDVSVANIDKAAPVGSVSYSNTAPTNQPVTATITSDKDLQDISGWTKVNATTFTKEYSDSASETVTITDLLGNTSTVSISITNIDIVAPTLTLAGVSETTTTTTKLAFTSDEAGTYYYLILEASEAAPSAAAIKAQGTAIAKGSDAAIVGEVSQTISGLSVSTSYKAYILVEDALGNQSAITSFGFATADSSDSSMASLSVNVGSLNPVFSPGVTSYQVFVANNVLDISFTPSANFIDATITVDGVAVASGSTSSPIALTDGATTSVVIEVTAQDGTTTTSYTIDVYRAAAGEANKSALNEAIAKADQIVQGTTTPVTSAFTTFDTARTDAATVLANTSATQAQVDAATSALNNAYNALKVDPITSYFLNNVNSHTIGSGQDITHVISIDWSLHNGTVSVDGVDLTDGVEYVSASGSTQTTLKAAYLDTLSVGVHTLKVTFAGNLPPVYGSFVILAKPSNPGSVGTGYDANMILWLAGLAGGATALGVVYRKKSKKKE